MKIKHLHLARFKRFLDRSFDFSLPENGKPLDLVVLVGDNGSGKSTILQAIIGTLGTATGQISSPNALNYPGYVYDSLSAAHRGYAEVTLTTAFDRDEISATQEYFNASDFSTTESAISPGNFSEVKFRLTNDPSAEYPVSAVNSKSAFFQARGRQYAFNLLRKGKQQPDLFKRVGGVFWYTEQRTAASLTPLDYTRSKNGELHSETYRNGDQLSEIRRMITFWNGESGQPKFHRLREKFQTVFPQKSLARVGTTYADEPPPVFFSDGMREYELEELSGGERALLPILMDFANWDINHSVILIDEIELHLHPPLQQTFLRVLPSLGHDNQFIITTHSDAIADLVPEQNIQRIQ
jgi:predicted ATPase